MKIITVRPGPEVIMWDDDGTEIGRVELTFDATRELLRSLLKEIPYGPDT